MSKSVTARRSGSIGLLFGLAALGVAGCPATTATTTARGPAIAREGASSGAMSRVGADDESGLGAVATASYPSVGAVPRAADATLGGDAVRAGSFSTPMPIAIGQTVQGRLERTDAPLEDGSVADDYVFVAGEGTSVHVELHGGEAAGQPGSHLDMYLYLLRDGVEIARNDDGGGNLDSLIEATLPTSGAYTLRVTTYGSGLREGAYTLSLTSR